MSRDIKDRLYIATVCGEHRQIIRKYGIGVELDQFCIVENMEGDGLRTADEEIRQLMELAKKDNAVVPMDADNECMAEIPRTSSTITDKDCATKNPAVSPIPAIFHGPFNELYPAAIDPKARALAMERLQQAYDLTASYGVDKLVVHSGYVPLVYFKEWHEERSVEFWEELMEGKRDRLKIVVENVMDDEPYMIAKMMERIKNPNIELCFDVGHAACISKVPPAEWLDVLAPYLSHFHIHNNDGTHDFHKPIHEGVVDMEAFLDKAIEVCASDATFTIESLEGLSSMEWLKEKGFI